MIGGLLLILLAVAGAMQAPFWSVPIIALMIGGTCSTAPFLRRRLSLPLLWLAVALAAVVAYAIGYGAGVALIG